MNKTLLFFFVLGLGLSSYSQKILWEKSFGGKHSEYLYDMLPTVDYGFIVAGSSLSGKSGGKISASQGNLDYFILKMDRNGQEEWQRSYGGDGRDLLQCLINTGDAGYLLAGTSDSGKSGIKTEDSQGRSDIWLIKINALGEQEWQKTIGGSGDDRLISVKKVHDGYILIANSNSPASGNKKSGNFGGLDYWIVKINTSGEIVWEQTYGGIYNDEVKSLLIEEDGFVVTGHSNSPYGPLKTTERKGGYDIWVMRLDADGNLENQALFGEAGDDYATDIYPHEEGYLISGTLMTRDHGQDFWLIKTDRDFEILEQYSYHFGGNDVLTGFMPDTENNVLLAGYKSHIKNGSKSYIAIKIELKEGKELWSKELSSSGDDLLRKAITTRDGGYVFAGNSNGKISGTKKSFEGRNDYWIVKLGTKEQQEVPENIIEAFPNPTEAFTQIVLNHEYKKGQAIVSNLNGKILQVIDLEYDMVTIDLGQYPTGVYIVNIRTDVINNSVKIIKK